MNLKIAVAQINTTPADITGNIARIITNWKKAESEGADLIVTPEQSISGYPLMDKAKNPDVLAAGRHGLQHLIETSRGMKSGIIVGVNEADENGNVYNVAYLVHDGIAEGPVRKRHLPNYDVFDEKRIYTAGSSSPPIEFCGHKLGILICEDLWHKNVAADLKAQGADILIVPNASPFYVGKQQYRLDDVMRARVAETGLPLVYVNQVGGCDELVFDGYSTFMCADGQIAASAPGFGESLLISKLQQTINGYQLQQNPAAITAIDEPMAQTYKALVLGTRDYLGKLGIKGVVMGISGGIDSGVVAAIAADALGPENVHLVKMPSQYSSADSITDSDDEARLLGAPIEEIAIEPIYNAFYAALSPHFNSLALDVTEENLQARARGTILMALSNKNGWLVLSTGNKSEVSVGYCTLYGDMNGGFNPLKDVWKMDVYALADWRNKNHDPMLKAPQGRVIPQNIIDKAPSAELAPGQFDSNSLPPYPVLDDILKRYVEQESAIDAIAQQSGHDKALIESIIDRVDRAEFKRQQACPGVKITERNFSLGRRVPIINPTIPTMLRNANKLAS